MVIAAETSKHIERSAVATERIPPVLHRSSSLVSAIQDGTAPPPLMVEKIN